MYFGLTPEFIGKGFGSALLTEAIAHLGEGVLITNDQLDPPGPQIVFVNEAMCRISGYSADELLGQSPRVLHSEKTSDETRAQIRRELSAGGSSIAYYSIDAAEKAGLGDFSRLPALLFFDEKGNQVLETEALVGRMRMLNSVHFVLQRAYEKGWTYQRFARTSAIERLNRERE